MLLCIIDRERLRKIRAACPNILLQCLVRGANGVGYTSYADNVVEEFVVLAAKNGMDVFRIFDCFNIVDNMRVCIDAVKKTGKVAEVCFNLSFISVLLVWPNWSASSFIGLHLLHWQCSYLLHL